MMSSLLSSNYPVPFYLIDKETVRLLDDFVYKQIKLILHPMRFNILTKRNQNNLQCFLNLYNNSFLDRYERAAYNDLNSYKEVSTLYNAVFLIIRSVTSDCICMESFTARRLLIYGVLEASTENIEDYLEESAIKFHLFAFLYDIIFKGLELTESKKEILKHRFGYSDRYEKLTCTEMAERLSITSQTVRRSEQSLERMIRDVIKVFKVFSPFY